MCSLGKQPILFANESIASQTIEPIILFEPIRSAGYANTFLLAICILCLVLLAALFYLKNIKLKLERCYQRSQAVLETMADGAAIIDEYGIVIYVNPALEKIFGYAKEEILLQNITLLMPSPHKEHHNDYLKAYLTTGVKRGGREAQGRRKDGSLFPLELSISEIIQDKKRLFIGMIRDISDKQAHENQLSQIAYLQKLYIRGESSHKIFNEILSYLLQQTDSEYGFIGVILEDNKGNKYLKSYAINDISWSEETRNMYNKESAEGMEFRNLDTLFGYTIKTGEIVISNNAKDDPRSVGLPVDHPEVHSYLGMPVHGKAGLIGMYGIANRQQGYDNEVVGKTTTITHLIGSIIESLRHVSLIKKMATKDPLTGVFNRYYFKSQLEEQLKQRVKQYELKKFCLMMIDINGFKKINDFYGHHYGDCLLTEFTNRLVNAVKSEDIIARVGGDEFLLLINRLNYYSDAGIIAQRLSNVFAKPYHIDSSIIEITATIGIACFPKSGKTINELMKNVDLALYKSKKQQKPYHYFSDELGLEFHQQHVLEEEIKNALINKEFYFVFQPQVDSFNNKIIGIEALVRWQNSQGHNVSPAVFVNTMENIGLAKELNRYTVNAVLNRLGELTSIEQTIKVSINLSPAMHNLAEHINSLVELVSDRNLDSNIKINFEITETGFMESNSELCRSTPFADNLKSRGIGLALDDFGVKYSSINRLFDYDFSTIKIDMSFIQNLDSPNYPHARIFVKSIIEISQSMDIEIIAEGVETKAQLEILQEVGGRFVQGYYFYKPMEWQALLEVANGFKIQRSE